MNFNDRPTHYDILDLKPDASLQEIKDAYLKAKATYNKDNLALYALISSAEREEALQQIEEAYQTLSDNEKRREYDRTLNSTPTLPPQLAPQPCASDMTNIDLPMDDQAAEDLLVAPVIDSPRGPKPPHIQAYAVPPPPERARAAEQGAATAVKPPGFKKAEQALQAPSEWTGAALKNAREQKGVTIEELSETTKVSKTYLRAIEEENFTRLPAAVFVRGFVTQFARSLHLPDEVVTRDYMLRFKRAVAGKED